MAVSWPREGHLLCWLSVKSTLDVSSNGMAFEQGTYACSLASRISSHDNYKLRKLLPVTVSTLLVYIQLLRVLIRSQGVSVQLKRWLAHGCWAGSGSRRSG